MRKDHLERRFWLALVAGGLALGVIPLIQAARVLAQPSHLLPRAMTGALIAAGVMAVATVLTRIPRLRQAGQLALVLLTGAAIVVFVWLAGARSREPAPLEDPAQAEWAGAVVVTVTWGVAALWVMAFATLARQARGQGHRGWVEELGQDAGYVASCGCGWRGEIVQDSSAAFTAAGDHANKVEITIRRRRTGDDRDL
ncbi:hypothetical protein HII36_46925 [Nonomuraea sp. NN258]|uniref:hypothetical protein n=1 Tax=Nonomuraea antri TaxID=2730852 RepID=UPI00156A70EC|nr:hypothetical protein [Nonomuraea antri]NRQ39308.1 hypothetical protein [Nonomuraea antri]